MTRRHLLQVLAVPTAAQIPCASAGGRTTFVLRDVSPSYKNSPEIVAKLDEIVLALVPGDTLMIFELGGPFKPELCVKVQCVLPRVPPVVLAPVRTLQDWRVNQGRLQAIWRQADLKKRAITQYIHQQPSVKSPTPLFEALDYAASRLASAGGVRNLVVFSDFIQDSDGVSSPLPPKAGMSFAGVSAFALFVPWQKGFAGREAAWRRWFTVNGACAFEMLDGAQSQIRRVLEAGPVPRGLPQRF